MNNENYITKDFNLAGYLLFNGYKLIDHPRTNGVTMFTFEDDGSIKVSLQKYYSMEALIEPIGSVSYTHLDVYKRQPLRLLTSPCPCS